MIRRAVLALAALAAAWTAPLGARLPAHPDDGQALAARANRGTVRIGGIDLQQGGQGQDYANFGLARELTGPLPAAERDSCRTAISDHLFKGFAAARQPILQSCLAAIRALPEPAAAQDRREHRAMQDMLGRFLALDLRDQRAFFAGRDQAMFDLLAWWQAPWAARPAAFPPRARSHRPKPDRWNGWPSRTSGGRPPI